MSKIVFSDYEGEGYIISFRHNQSSTLEVEVTLHDKGYIRLADMTESLKNGRCSFDTKKLADGEYEPILTVDGCEVRMPKLVCRGGIISTAPIDEAFVRELSLKIFYLTVRLGMLEKKQEDLSERVYSSTIF